MNYLLLLIIAEVENICNTEAEAIFWETDDFLIDFTLCSIGSEFSETVEFSIACPADHLIAF